MITVNINELVLLDGDSYTLTTYGTNPFELVNNAYVIRTFDGESYAMSDAPVRVYKDAMEEIEWLYLARLVSLARAAA